jgi:hypothetical protein
MSTERQSDFAGNQGLVNLKQAQQQPNTYKAFGDDGYLRSPATPEQVTQRVVHELHFSSSMTPGSAGSSRLHLTTSASHHTIKTDAIQIQRSDWEQMCTLAATIRDTNVQLVAENEALRARIVELEKAMTALGSDLTLREEKEESESGEGNVRLITSLQMEVADLRRQVSSSKQACSHFASESEAAALRTEVLQAQVERLLDLLDEAREEKDKLLKALVDLDSSKLWQSSLKTNT